MSVERRIGLVLSGGGAKGAYEIGVWKALKRLGVISEIDGIFGTSVGALNAVLLDCRSVEAAEEIWNSLPGKHVFGCWGLDNSITTKPQQNLKDKVRDYVKKQYSPENVVRRFMKAAYPPAVEAELMLYLLKNGLPFTQKNLKALFKEEILPKIDNSQREISVVCKEAKDPHYAKLFRLKDYPDHSQKIRIILASSAMPYWYRGVVNDGIEIDGTKYFDGGFKDDRSNTPIEYMHEKGWDRIIAVWLDPSAKVRAVPGCSVINIIPSDPRIQGRIPGLRKLYGVINLQKEKIKNDIQMGYADTMQMKAEICRMAGITPPQ